MNAKLAKKLRRIAKQLSDTQSQSGATHFTDVNGVGGTIVLNNMSSRGMYVTMKRQYKAADTK